jgi:nucleotide-binding universal stress UspA family protein
MEKNMASLIIVPLDGSSFAEMALSTAFTLARAWNAEIEVVTAHDPTDKKSTEGVEEYLAGVVARIRDEVGFDVTSALAAGSPAEALEQHVRSTGADLVVMTSHGRGPLSRIWLGSVTDAFIRRASTPVLLVRPGEGEELDLSKEITFERVLIPVDGSEGGDAILTSALALGKACDSEFVLLKVSGATEAVSSSFVPYAVRVNPKTLDDERKKAEEDLDVRVQRLIAEGVAVTGQVALDNSPSEGVLRFAAENDIDLIAMATHGRGGVARMVLGSVTDKVVRGATQSVLVRRPPVEEG